MKIEASVGDHISTVASRAVTLVADGEPVVTFDFNDIPVTVTPGMSAGDVCAVFERESQARYDAYLASPEYKARQQEAEAAERRANLEREQCLATAPTAMTLRDPDGWAKAKAANTDGYGGAVMAYAERWARLMEGAIAGGATVAGCARRTASVADVEGITGFIYGCAVATLAAVWIHGEELRLWHNTDSQLADEGDRANESGGVLNPAVISLGGR